MAEEDRCPHLFPHHTASWKLPERQSRACILRPLPYLDLLTLASQPLEPRWQSLATQTVLVLTQALGLGKATGPGGLNE